jgi:hypothetical protein
VERPPLRHASGCFRAPPTRTAQWVRLVSARFVSRNASFPTKCVMPQRPDLGSLTPNTELATGTEKMQRGMRRYRLQQQHQCRDAGKIDWTRRATLTKLRRVAGACQSSLHKPQAKGEISEAAVCVSANGDRRGGE